MKTIKLALACAMILILAGCSSTESNQEQQPGQEQAQEDKSTGIPPLDIKNRAEKNIDKAVDEENNKIDKAMEEAGLNGQEETGEL